MFVQLLVFVLAPVLHSLRYLTCTTLMLSFGCCCCCCCCASAPDMYWQFSRDRPRAERIVLDCDISVGWMHSGYPIMGYTSIGLGLMIANDIGRSQSWGAFHGELRTECMLPYRCGVGALDAPGLNCLQTGLVPSLLRVRGGPRRCHIPFKPSCDRSVFNLGTLCTPGVPVLTLPCGCCCCCCCCCDNCRDVADGIRLQQTLSTRARWVLTKWILHAFDMQTSSHNCSQQTWPALC